MDYRQTLIRERMLSTAVAETKQEVDDLTAHVVGTHHVDRDAGVDDDRRSFDDDAYDRNLYDDCDDSDVSNDFAFAFDEFLVVVDAFSSSSFD